MKKTVALIIMDGYGLSDKKEGNAVYLAYKPNLDKLMKEYPTNVLKASGEAVGLPEGQMGNSEVGHLTIGSGRIVYQSLTRINIAIKDGTFFKNPVLLKAIDYAKTNNSRVHILGLTSNGGVHCHTSHIISLLKLCNDSNVESYVHCFLDGRDTPPQSAKDSVAEVMKYGNVATVSGRYYAMDRDKNFDRIQKAYNAMMYGEGEYFSNPVEGIENSYNNGVNDEFVIPFVSNKNGMIKENDCVIFANFRPDRAIEIATAISNPSACPIIEENKNRKIHFVSMMHYSENVLGDIAYGPQDLGNMLGDVLSENNIKQLRIAETEKYAHVTFFFDGGLDKEIKGSKRVLINSPKVATYDLQPEMSAYEVTENVLREIESNEHDCIILNFANCDMVGHTGVIPAVVKAVSVVDECVGKVYNAIKEKNGVCIITADHGNAEKLLDVDGSPFTAHTTNLVPVIVTDKSVTIKDNKGLSDIAPTILKYLEIDKPAEMTGESII